MKRGSKYNVAPAEQRRALGRTFASKAENEYALQLEMCVECGIIIDYICQPKVWLGCVEYTYSPDFLVIPEGAAPHYVDVKGMETTAFKRTKKLWAGHGRLPLHVVKKKAKGFETTEVIK